MKLYVKQASRVFSLVWLLILILLSNQFALAQFVCQPSTAPTVTTTGALTSADPMQTGRIVRDGVTSSCTGKTNGLQNATAVSAKPYTFTSPVTGCATVDIDFRGCALNQTEIVAYSAYNPLTPNTGVIGDPGLSTTGIASFSFSVTQGQPFTLVVHEIAPGTGCASFKFSVSYSTACRQAGFDRTNDGKADLTYWRPTTGVWNTINSAGGTNTVQFGQSGDITVAGDYTGDGQTDVGVYRPGNNSWYYGLSQTTPSTSFFGLAYGAAGDVPVPGDYDRDGKTDIAVWRPSSGFWYVLRSSDNTLLSQQWGQMGDTPVVGDFDGDRINDFGVVRPNDTSTGGTANRWYILESNFNYGFFASVPFGLSSDKLVPADFDGDGKSDIAVWRPSDGFWYFIRSSTNAVDYFQFGANGDIPQPADYDGDKKADFAVFRSGIWYIRNSQTNTFSSIPWGTATDQPATSPYKVQ